MSDGFKVSERPHGQVPVLSRRPGMVDVVGFDYPPRKQLEGPDVRSVFVTPTNAELAAWRTVAAAVHVLDRAGVPDDAVRLMGGVMVALHIRLSVSTWVCGRRGTLIWACRCISSPNTGWRRR